jgi:hypothetical protein
MFTLSGFTAAARHFVFGKGRFDLERADQVAAGIDVIVA